MSLKKKTPKTPLKGEVYQVDFDPSRGSEIKKKRPAVVVSNNHMNQLAATILVMPITAGKHPYFFRIPLHPPEGGIRKVSHIVTEQVTVVDKSRLGRHLGKLEHETIQQIEQAIRDHFGLPEGNVLS